LRAGLGVLFSVLPELAATLEALRTTPFSRVAETRPGATASLDA
jgi:hypothetical protein